MALDIILNLAVSLDGFICDEDGGFAWIGGQGDSLADTADRFSFDAFLASCDTVIMGRKAYDDCFSSLSEAEDKRFLVASRTPRAPEGPVSFLSGDVVSEVLALKGRPGKHIWLFGGGELAADFIRADAVDRYIGDPRQGTAAVPGGASVNRAPSGPLHRGGRHPHPGVQPAGPVRKTDNSRREHSLRLLFCDLRRSDFPLIRRQRWRPDTGRSRSGPAGRRCRERRCCRRRCRG